MKKNINKRWLSKLLSLTVAVSMLVTAGPAIGLVYEYEDGQRALSGHLKGDSGEKETAADITMENEVKYKTGLDVDNMPKGVAAALKMIDLSSWGLSLSGKINIEHDGGKPTFIKDADGNILGKFNYTGDGKLQSFEDRVNRAKTHFSTSNTYRYARTFANHVGGTYNYQYATMPSVTVNNAVGLMTHVSLMDSSGNELNARNVYATSSYERGFFEFAEGSPLVPEYGGYPPTGSNRTSSSDKLISKRFEYDVDGNPTREVQYAWSAGGRLNTGRQGRYVYMAKSYNEDGSTSYTSYNDPAPSRYEPTFVGTLVKDAYGKFGIQVQTAEVPRDSQGNPTENVDVSKCINKTFLITTRYSDEGGQPYNSFRDMDARTATEGGAAFFSSKDLDSLVGKQISITGHILGTEDYRLDTSQESGETRALPRFRVRNEQNQLVYESAQPIFNSEKVDIFSVFSDITEIF